MGRWSWRCEAVGLHPGAPQTVRGRRFPCLESPDRRRSLLSRPSENISPDLRLSSDQTWQPFGAIALLPLSPKLRPALLDRIHLLKLSRCSSVQSSQRCFWSCRVPAPSLRCVRNYRRIDMDFFTCHAYKRRGPGASCCQWAAVITLGGGTSDRQNE